jgi:hypothetical protein
MARLESSNSKNFCKKSAAQIEAAFFSVHWLVYGAVSRYPQRKEAFCNYASFLIT